MSRDRNRRTEAIVMKRRDYGEADRMLSLYTREFGKLDALAKGARKPQSRKTGHVELFMRTNFMIAEGRNFGIITQAELVEAYPDLREDLIRTTYAAYATELLDKFTADEDKNISLYELLGKGLGWFNQTDNLRLAARYYELRLLSLAGFQPQLFRCVATGEPVEQEDQYFSAELGGLLKTKARSADYQSKGVSSTAVKLLRYLQTRDWPTIQAIQLRPSLHNELENILHDYITYHLERNLKSVDFLNRLRREAALFSDDPPPTEP